MVASEPKLGWSRFALDRHEDPTRRAFDGTPDQLLERVRARWNRREPGFGRSDLTEVVVVPVDPEGFRSSTVVVSESTPLHAELHRRQEGETPVIQVLAEGTPEPVRFAKVVLYSAQTLLENGGTRSTDADWEVVALVAGPVEDEPMHPITMARNYLAEAGGTPAPYTAEQFARAVWYWATRAKVYVDSSE